MSPVKMSHKLSDFSEMTVIVYKFINVSKPCHFLSILEGKFCQTLTLDFLKLRLSYDI